MLSRLELKVCPSSETLQLETAMTLPSRFRVHFHLLGPVLLIAQVLPYLVG